MTLIERVRELQELETKASPGKWGYEVDAENFPDGTGTVSDDMEIITERGDTVFAILEYREYDKSIENAEFISYLRNAASDLLDVLSGFKEGDENGINRLIEWLDSMQKSSDFVISPELMQLLIRHRSMARKMEGKR